MRALGETANENMIHRRAEDAPGSAGGRETEIVEIGAERGDQGRAHRPRVMA